MPEAAFWQWLRQTGRCVEEQAGREALWRGRRVRVVDGSTEKIAETAANCAEYPRQRGQRPGASYPVVRVLVVFSLAVGTVLEALMRPYQGKGTGETSMLRELASCFASGDVLLGDRYFAGYWDLAFWGRRGVDVVTRAPVSRRSDFRRGKRLGKDDHLIVWKRGQRPDWVTADEADEFPRTLTLREVRVRVTIPGFRTRSVVLITTLLDPASYPVSALADLYRQRLAGGTQPEEPEDAPGDRTPPHQNAGDGSQGIRDASDRLQLCPPGRFGGLAADGTPGQPDQLSRGPANAQRVPAATVSNERVRDLARAAAGRRRPPSRGEPSQPR